MIMTRPLTQFFATALLAGALLAPAVAHAFTMDDGNKGSTSIPKFDLDEQTRHFRKPDLSTPGTDKKGLETPFGNLQFGVDQNPTGFRTLGPGFGSSFNSNADRKHLDRMFTPGYLQGRGD